MLVKFSLFALASFALTFALAMAVAAIIKLIGLFVHKGDNNAPS